MVKSTVEVRVLKQGFYSGPMSQAVDEAARVGIPIEGFVLMRRAAQAALDVIRAQYPYAARLLVVCGKGNNGGDGYLLATLAKTQGLEATVVSIVPPDELQGDAALAHAAAVDAGVEHQLGLTELANFDVVVDAMLGTGFRDEPRGEFVAAINAINASTTPVVSIDIPSGVDATTGGVSLAIAADHTVTFITRKIGTYTGPGRSQCGVVHYKDLSVPERLYPDPQVLPCRWEPSRLAALDSGAYKHQMGHVLVAGGDLGMPGAVTMASEAALRVGAGMVTVATRTEHAQSLLARVPEAMTIDAEGEDFTQRLSAFDLVVLGPGLGRANWGQKVYERIEAAKLPTVLDADGLFWLAQNKTWHGGALAMTPHAAEAARLLDVSVADIERDRIGAAQTLAERYQARVNLKGPGSILVVKSSTQLCVHGNPGMATAGMGDVLSGIVGGLLAGAYRGKDTDKTVDDLFSAAVALHSCAADNAARHMGMRSLVATDVVNALPGTIQGIYE